MLKAYVITVLVVFLAGLSERDDTTAGKAILFGGLSFFWIVGAIVALCVG